VRQTGLQLMPIEGKAQRQPQTHRACGAQSIAKGVELSVLACLRGGAQIDVGGITGGGLLQAEQALVGPDRSSHQAQPQAQATKLNSPAEGQAIASGIRLSVAVAVEVVFIGEAVTVVVPQVAPVLLVGVDGQVLVVAVGADNTAAPLPGGISIAIGIEAFIDQAVVVVVFAVADLGLLSLILGADVQCRGRLSRMLDILQAVPEKISLLHPSRQPMLQTPAQACGPISHGKVLQCQDLH